MIHLTINAEQIVETAIGDADAVGISILSGTLTLVPRILDLLRKDGAGRARRVGGTVPQATPTRERGQVAEVFGLAPRRARSPASSGSSPA
jgi:methylmalonyl-CoA mutase cobalamin-binding domain/chain